MTQFRVTYDGPALAEHQMDARELAPALIAIADLLEASCAALYGDKAKPVVNVQGSFKTGSFNIDFVTAVNWLTSMRDLMAGPNATAAANALAVLGAIGFLGRIGVAQVLKWLQGRRITNVVTVGEHARIYAGDDMIEVELDTLHLLRSVSVRTALSKVVAPLDTPGITTFAVGSGDDFSLVLDEGERAYFAAPAGEDQLVLTDVRTMAFSIVSLAFKDDNKWRLTDGSATISARIADVDFLAQVNANTVSFSKGDVLLCEVRITQWQTESGAKTEYEVLKVLEHRRSPPQITLPGI